MPKEVRIFTSSYYFYYEVCRDLHATSLEFYTKDVKRREKFNRS